MSPVTNPTPRDSVQLPPLPYPAHRGPDGTGCYFDAFTGAQMNAHYLKGYNEARAALDAKAGQDHVPDAGNMVAAPALGCLPLVSGSGSVN